MYWAVGGAGSLSSTCFHKIIACGALRLCEEPSKCAPQARPAMDYAQGPGSRRFFWLFPLKGL